MTDGISAEQHDDIMCSSEATPLDELLRLSASSAMLFNSMEMIDITDCDVLSSLLANCITQRELNLAWYDQRQADIGEALFCHTSDNILGHNLPAFGELFGPVLQFSSLDSARLHVMFYNAMRLVQDLISRANVLILTNMDTLHLCENDTLLEIFYADQIAQSIPFCLQDRNRTCLAHLSILLLGQISQTYIKARSSDKVAWCIDTLKVIHSMGFSSAGHRKAMMLDEWNRTQMEQQTSMERSQWEIIEMPNKSQST